jgi:hypothetical protein
MDIENYFKNLTNEIESLKDRVRHCIDDVHWLSDGEWKESVLRAILRRHLPRDIGVGRGFIVNIEQTSTQIDILLYDKTRPILFQDGDFIIITLDTAKGVIEVKTKIRQQNELRDALNKLCGIAQFINPISVYGKNQFFGLFSYEEVSFNRDTVLEIVQDCVNGQHQRVVNCLSFGKHYFVRYWPTQPNTSGVHGYNKWHAYHLENKAPAYFIHNVIDHLCPQWASDNNDVWYPEDGKENYKISDKFLYKPEQIH